ncbi:MAG: hypothetical protein PWQ22_1552 [Archaeoglobaceae archaeon]|nr:hypothetical protein [Archaeoglobaceae archaeon]
MFHMEQTGTYSESDRKKLGIGKEAQGRHDLHIRISSENYIFLKEYFRNRFSSHGRDLNPRPLAYQASALPAELPWLFGI